MSEKDGGPKLTPWYPPEIKPVRVGWYQRSLVNDSGFPDCIWMNWFDGTDWFYNQNETSKAAAFWKGAKEMTYGELSAFQWRGLTERSK